MSLDVLRLVMALIESPAGAGSAVPDGMAGTIGMF